MGRASWAHHQGGGVAPKLDTASHFPLLLPEAVGAGWAQGDPTERSVSDAWAASARSSAQHDRRGHRERGLAAQKRSVPLGAGPGAGAA